jgi:hypothetical protein
MDRSDVSVRSSLRTRGNQTRSLCTAEEAWFDKLTMSARPEPFDSPLILSLSKDERLLRTGLSKDGGLVVLGG